MYCYKLFPDGEQSRINKDKDHKETFNSTLKSLNTQICNAIFLCGVYFILIRISLLAEQDAGIMFY